jgi:hypothetical protein
MTNYISQLELRARGWIPQQIAYLGRPDAAMLDDVAHPPGQYVSLRAEHGDRAQRAWTRERVQARELKRKVLGSGAAMADLEPARKTDSAAFPVPIPMRV